MSDSYIHEIIRTQPDIQVRYFSYEDAGVFVTRHWHNSLEILYIDEGEMEIDINGSLSRLKRSGFVIINSREIHATQCKEHSRIYVLQIPYHFLRQHITSFETIRFDASMPALSPAKRETASGEFGFLMQRMQDIYTSKAEGFQLRFYSLLYELLYLMVTSCKVEFPDGEPALQEENRRRLSVVMDYVNSHYTEPLKVRDAAGQVALNPEYFCRFFKKNMGVTFLNFVNQVRFSHICDDLLRTDINITELLQIHGFTNYKLFSRMFRAQYGCTPSQKRKEASRSGN